MDPTELRKAVNAIRWAHRIDLGHGIVTPGDWNTPEVLSTLQLPADLSGQTVLDVGCWDGFYSFAAEQRGAAARAGYRFVHLAGRPQGRLPAGAAALSGQKWMPPKSTSSICRRNESGCSTSYCFWACCTT